MKYKELVADFETVREKENSETQRVWLWAVRVVSTIKDEYNEIGNNITSFFDYINSLKGYYNIFFHNLKFDGDYIVNYLLQNGYKWTEKTKHNEIKINEFTTNVSFLGVVYSISLKTKNGFIVFRDSLKLFQASEKQLAIDYQLDTVKGEIDYNKYRDENYIPTQEEIEYIKNDTYIIAYILATFRQSGFKKYTTASSALYEFLILAFPRKDGKVNYLTSLKMFKEKHPITKDEDLFCRKAYNGGFCFVNPKYKNKEIGKGIVLDVNSMYPAQMKNQIMPYGQPMYYKGKYRNFIKYPLYIQRIKIDFKTKPNCPPIIQNKKRLLPWLTSRSYITDTEGHIIELTLTSVDLDILLKTSEVYYLEYIDGYAFKGKKGGFFVEYIEKFLKMKNDGKIENNASKKQFGKLYMNSLYGKLACKLINSVMQPYIDKNNHLRYREIGKTESDPLYVPLACFITAYGRLTLFDVMLKNYDRFLYCDTDSVHLIGTDLPKNIEIDPTKLGAWDLEFKFTKAKYLGCKTYIEMNDEKTLVKCAGLSTNISIDENYKIPDGVNVEVNFDNFNYNSQFLRKQCFTGINGKYIDYSIFTLKERN